MKKLKKILLLFGISLVLAFLTEGVLSIFPSFYKNQILDHKQHILTLDDFDKSNWVENEDGTITSLPDPILVTYDLNMYIDNIEIHADTAAGVIYGVSLFYSNDDVQYFSEDGMIRNDQVFVDTLSMKIDHQVRDLRIDLGEEQGLVLNDVYFVINPDGRSFSISRFVAVFIIVFATYGLFTLQSRPKYFDLSQQNNSDDARDSKDKNGQTRS